MSMDLCQYRLYDRTEHYGDVSDSTNDVVRILIRIGAVWDCHQWRCRFIQFIISSYYDDILYHGEIIDTNICTHMGVLVWY